MTHKFLIVLLAITINSCKAQQTLKNNTIMIPKIDNTFETFDFEKYTKNLENKTRSDEIVEDKHIIRIKSNAGSGENTFFNSSYFMIIKNHFPNGNIDIKGIGFNNGSQYGIWYKFDKKGNLVEEINTDKGYDFGWEQVIKYCEDNKIALTKGYERGGWQTTIYKEEIEGKKVWIITYQLPVGDKLMEITLDGKTGKELKQKELKFIGS